MPHKAHGNDLKDGLTQEDSRESVPNLIEQVILLGYVAFTQESVIVVGQSKHDRINENNEGDERVKVLPCNQLD